MGPYIVVGQMPVVEAGLGRETTVRVETVEIQIKQLVDRRPSRHGLELASIDLGDQFASDYASLARGSKATPGDLLPSAGRLVTPERDLQVPAPLPSRYTPTGLVGIGAPPLETVGSQEFSRAGEPGQVSVR